MTDDTSYFRIEEGSYHWGGLSESTVTRVVWVALLVAVVEFWAVVVWALASNV